MTKRPRGNDWQRNPLSENLRLKPSRGLRRSITPRLREIKMPRTSLRKQQTPRGA
jgi:hypothetical protein